MKGHKARPVCEEETFSIQLKHERKIVYLGTQRFLLTFHCYRRLRKAFNGSTEEEKALKPLNGEQVYQRVKHLIISYEKRKQNTIEKNVRKSNQ